MVFIFQARNWCLTFLIHPTNIKCVSHARDSLHFTQASDRAWIQPEPGSPQFPRVCSTDDLMPTCEIPAINGMRLLLN